MVIRYRRADQDAGGRGQQQAHADALGELVEISPTHVVVRTRRGAVRIARDAVVAAKEVPPPPARRGRPHLVVSPADLELLAVEANPADETARLGQWLLRRSDVPIGRASSALPYGDPGVAVDEALARVHHWYAERDADPMIQLWDGDEATEMVGARAVALGWERHLEMLVMTAPTAEVRMAARPPKEVRVNASDHPDDAWFAACSPRSAAHRELLEPMLDRVVESTLLTARDDDGTPIGAARTVATPGWWGLMDVHTLPEHRGRGVAVALTAAAAEHHADRPATYLQVLAENRPAVQLYERLGWTTHHRYTYLRRPAAAAQ